MPGWQENNESTRVVSNSNPQVQFKGPGMPPSSINLIFIPYNQVNWKIRRTFTVLVILLIFTNEIYCSPVKNIHRKGQECPSSQHLTSLAKPAKSRIQLNGPANVKCFCSVDSHPVEGWEITCLEESPPEQMKREKVNPFTQTTRVNESTGAYPSLSSNAFDPNYKNNGNNNGRQPMYTLSTSPLGFTVKNENGKVVEISCDSAVPDFKPAMFQGKFTFNSLFSYIFSLIV